MPPNGYFWDDSRGGESVTGENGDGSVTVYNASEETMSGKDGTMDGWMDDVERRASEEGTRRTKASEMLLSSVLSSIVATWPACLPACCAKTRAAAAAANCSSSNMMFAIVDSLNFST